MTSLGNTAARGTGITLAGQGVRALLQTASVIVLARLLTPDDFGIVAMVVAITGVADIIRDFGLSSAAIQAKSLSAGERTNLFWANVGIGFACSVVAMAATPLIVLLYGEPRIAPIVLAVAGVFLVTGANTQLKAELSRELRFAAMTGADITAQFLGIGTAIALALAGAGYWSIVAQQIIVPVVTLLVNAWSCRWRPGWPDRSVSITRFFRFGGGLMGTQLLSYASKNIDNILIGAFYGPLQLGLYSRAYQLLMTPLNQINAPLTSVALPVLSRVQDDQEVYSRYLRRAQVVGCYVTATVLAVCAGLAVPVVDILFGPKWSVIAPVFAILAIGGIFRAVAQLSYWIYLSRGFSGAQLKIFIIIRPVIIGLIVAGLPWGIEGVAVGCTLGALVQWVVPMWHVGRVAGVDSGGLMVNAFRAMVIVSAPCAGFAYLGTLVASNSFVQVGAGLGFVAAFLALIGFLVRPVREDFRVVASMIMRAMGRVAR